MALSSKAGTDRLDLVGALFFPSTLGPVSGDPDRGTRLLSAMLDGTRDNVTIKDVAGRYLFVNPAAAEWFDLPVASIVGRTNRDLLKGELAVSNEERDRLLLAGGERIEYEEVLIRDGVTRSWLTTKDLIRDQSGEIIGLGAISREITDRVTAEQALARSTEALDQTLRLLGGILGSTTDHVCVRDLDGRFLLVNRACATWYGATPEAMIGVTCAELFGPAEAESIARRDRQLLETGAAMSYEETLTRNGVTRTWLTTRDLIRDESGRLVAHFAISREITELRRAEEQSRQSQKMESIGRLAGGIAHDFNNLLTVISGNAQFLVADLGDHPGRAAAEEIATAANRAATVTRQLLAFSRQQVLAPELLDVQAVVTDIEPLVRRLVGALVEVETRFADEPGLVRVDRSQLEQVVMNLVVNARDAMPDGGRLTIWTANVDLPDADPRVSSGVAPGPYVELAVTDSGVGIDPTVRDRIFEPFFTTKEPGKGTGLGLAMVEGVVRQSGGDIRVDSQPGAGTTFRVYLPRLSQAAVVTTTYHVATGDPGGDELLLLVEDEPGVREVARRILSAAGYTVLEAADPDAAFTLIRERGIDIDLLLTDVVMPGGTGPVVARALAAENPGAAVLYMSGYTDDAISHQGVLEPDVSLITKPFSSEGLLSAVRSVLRARRLSPVPSSGAGPRPGPSPVGGRAARAAVS